MNINEAYEFLNFISNKNQSGTITPSQFNQLATQAQWEFFEKAYAKWQDSQDTTDDISPLIKHIATSVSATGRLPYPSDYEHALSTGHYFVKNDNTGIDVPIKEVDNDKYREYLQSEIVTPTLRFPIWTAYSDYMQFEPKNIGLVSFDYFRKPADPVWGFTVVNNRPVYDPTTSVNWELPVQTHLTMVMMMCNYLGQNLRMPDMVQYTEMQKSELK